MLEEERESKIRRLVVPTHSCRRRRRLCRRGVHERGHEQSPEHVLDVRRLRQLDVRGGSRGNVQLVSPVAPAVGVSLGARERVEEVASGRRLSDRQRGWHGHLQGEGVELVPARANPRGVLGDASRVHRGRVHADEDVGAVPGVGGGGALRGIVLAVRRRRLGAVSALALSRGRCVEVQLEDSEAARARRLVLRGGCRGAILVHLARRHAPKSQDAAGAGAHRLALGPKRRLVGPAAHGSSIPTLLAHQRVSG